MASHNDIINGAISVARGLAKMGVAKGGVLISREEGQRIEAQLAKQSSFKTIKDSTGASYRTVTIAAVVFRWPGEEG